MKIDSNKYDVKDGRNLAEQEMYDITLGPEV